jgi:DNA-binding GntR family transcriptional regulator
MPDRTLNASDPHEDAGDASAIVQAKLRRLILMGGIAPGTALNQEALADDFGVSRMPIRQALKRLQTEGLVERQQNRRVHVTLLQRGEIEDIFDMRIALEPMALRLAIPLADKHDVRAMSRALEDIEDDDDPATFGMRNTAYHMALVQPCERPRLLAEIRSLLDLSDRYQRAAVADTTFTRPLQDEHEAMLAAVREGRADDGAAILERHIRQGRDRLVELFS